MEDESVGGLGEPWSWDKVFPTCIRYVLEGLIQIAVHPCTPDIQIYLS
jgi:hypothetical protein